MNTFISKTTAFVYQQFLKPVLFRIDAETVHDTFVTVGKTMGSVPIAKQLTHNLYSFHDSRLVQKIKKIEFSNPIGLAAGFDYDANLTQILGDLGFGFQTVGTITAEYYEGNTKPRLGRLPQSKSLLVNKGYKSAGVDAIVQKLHPLQFNHPLGISVGSTNKEYNSIQEQIQSFVDTFKKLETGLSRHSYYELNISCPNLKTGESFTTPKALKALLTAVEKLRLKKPVFIKMPTDISIDQSMELLKIADKFTIAGAIFGNLTKDRKNPDLVASEVAQCGAGNFSGKPTEKRSNALLASAYQQYGKRFIFIGCGGVFNAEDAYRKIKLGATVVQMITGMIFQGPQVVGQINQGLAELLERDGYSNISEAIGADFRKK